MTSSPPRVNPPRPLLWLSLAFLAGIVLASQVHLGLPVWLGLALLILLAVISLQYCRARFQVTLFNLPASIQLWLGLSLLVLMLGGLRYQAAQPVLSPFFVAWYNDREYKVTLTGWLVAPPDQRDGYTNLRLQVGSLDTGDQSLPVQGLVLVRLPPGTDYQVGDVLRLRGYLKTPPENEDFSYRDYLAR
jgi:competence protein ComEC